MSRTVFLGAAAALIAALLAGCSTIDSRIRDHQAAFDASSPEAQKKIRAGRIAVGFTQEQVAMALGRPDRIISRTTAGSDREFWVYGIDDGGTSFGVGFGAFGPHTAVGVNTGVGEGWPGAARLRVIFDNGLVTSIESRQ